MPKPYWTWWTTLQILSKLRNLEHAISYTWRSCPLIPCLVNSYFFLILHVTIMTSEFFHDLPLQSSTYHNWLVTFTAHSKNYSIFLCLFIFYFLPLQIYYTRQDLYLSHSALHPRRQDRAFRRGGIQYYLLFGSLAGRLGCMICRDLSNNQNQSPCLLMADNCNPRHSIKKELALREYDLYIQFHPLTEKKSHTSPKT